MNQPELKAKELYDFYFPLVEAYSATGQDDNAKKCAEYHCDGIIKESSDTICHIGRNQLSDMEYWVEVKESITKL